MSYVDFDGKNIKLYIPYSEKDLISFLPEKYSTISKCYLLPPSTVFDLQLLFPNIIKSNTFLELEKKYLDEFNKLSLLKSENIDMTLDIFENTGLKEYTKIRKYQLTGILFCYQRKKVLLADEMGLGKGLISLATTLLTKKYNNVKKVLIICPNSIKFSVWEKEIQKWTDEPYLIIGGSKERKESDIKNLSKYFYIVINYEAIRLKKNGDTNNIHKSLYNWNPNFIILDECHAIKNKDALQTKAIKLFKPEFCILATGTPVLNKTNELWSLLNYLDAEYWSSYWKFIQRYCILEEKYVGYNRKVKVISGSKNLDELKERMFPYYIGRTKKEVMSYLPDKIYETRFMSLLDEQKKIYNELITNLITEIEGKIITINRQFIVTKLLRLLQVCDTLQTLGGKDISIKLDECENIVNDLSLNHKIVFFTWFKETARALETRLLNKNINVVRIDGEVKEKQRKELIDKFQSDKNCRVFIATLSTCGVGIDLTCADVCVFVSRSYTPAINDQAESRLHRSGQKNVVNIITLITQGTIEEKISILLENKKDLFKTLFREYDKQEVKNLFVKVT